MVFVYVLLIIVALVGAAYIYMLYVRNNILKKRKGLSKSLRVSIEEGTFNEKNDEGYTPLMLTIMGQFDKSFEKLLFAGADVNIKGDVGEQVLHLAAHHSDEKKVKEIIEAGAEINTKDAQGCTPLWYAAQNNKFKNLELLIDEGAELNDVDATYGLSPLMIAAQNGAYNCVDLLLKNDADKTIEANDFGSAYDIAKERLLGNIKQNKSARNELEEMVEKLKYNFKKTIAK